MSTLQERLRGIPTFNNLRPGAIETCLNAAKALDAAEAKLAAIDARHQPLVDQAIYMPGEPEPPVCGGCYATWPCPDHLTLHPEEGTSE